jgi:uncharacterized protein (DUF3820 family)
MTLPFGKHKGEDIVDVPLDYLQWLEEQDWLQADLRERVQFEIKRRTGDVTSLGRDIKPGRFKYE